MISAAVDPWINAQLKKAKRVDARDSEQHCENCGKSAKKYWVVSDHLACTKKCLENLIAHDAYDAMDGL